MKFTKLIFASILSLSLVASSIPVSAAKAPPNMVVHFINIGQGDATYIKMPSGEDILIDGGNKGKGKDVVAYLKKQKVDDIEIMIATHPDADHIGGLDEVLAAYKVESVYAPKVSHTTQAYKDFLKAVQKEKLKIKQVKMNDKLPIKNKDVKAVFKAPVKDYNKNDLNNWSAVLRINYNKTSFLFTGDAEELSEKDMIKAKMVTKVDVLKVSHHGAKSASSQPFLNIAKPKFAVISVGAKNSYKHPTSETLNRLKNVKATVFRTDKNGNMRFISNGTKITTAMDKR